MLSIGAMSLGGQSYYLALAREDYYLEGGEPKGYWIGQGARRLSYSGSVAKSALSNLFNGFSEDGRRLVQNAGKTTGPGARKPGWDLTFSAPKSVSVFWSQAGEADRQQIQQAHAAAVEKAIAYLEDTAAFSRTGKGGSTEVPAGLIVAAFEHGTSRALDPGLHTHCLVLNVGTRPDGSTGSLLSKPFYRHKMTAGAIYRAELAHLLALRLGLRVERIKSWFEIVGVPKSLCHWFSKRRTAIDKDMTERGVETASAAAYAALSTREVKDIVPPRSQLFESWREEGPKHWFGAEAIEFLKGRRAPPKDQSRQASRAIHEALQTITASASHFSEQELLRHTAIAAQDKAVPVEYLRAAVSARIKSSPDIIHLGTRNDEQRYTTRQVFDLEKELLDTAHKLHQRKTPALKDKTVAAVIKKKRTSKAPDGTKHRFTLSFEQARAVEHITQGPGAIKCVTGLAGTGKTTMLQATREAFEKEGYRVIGVCTSGKAAKGLQEGSGIESDTLAMRLLQLYPSPAYLAKHHAKQLLKVALRTVLPTLRLKTFKPERLKIDRRTVVVLDEASMVGTAQMNLLIQAVRKGKGRLILVGDQKQLPAIEAGGSFGSIAARYGALHLEEITRQKKTWAREAVKQLSRGEAEEVLKTYAEKGLLSVEPTKDKADAALIHDWKRPGGAHAPAQHVIGAATNEDVHRYNQIAQAERAEAGQLDLTRSLTVGDETFYPGDRIAFHRKSRKLGIENGDAGTVTAIKDWGWTKALAVQIDGAKQPIEIPVRTYLSQKYAAVRLGYAFTTHKLQGATVENSYIALGGSMTDREMSYVQGSRARNSTRLYAVELEAGEALTELARHQTPAEKSLDSPLAKMMDKSRQKTLAHDVAAADTWTNDVDKALSALPRTKTLVVQRSPVNTAQPELER